MRPTRHRRLAGSAIVVAVVLAGPAKALTIVAGFDTTITSDPAAAGIESAINTAISTIDQLYINNVTVPILFTEGSGSFVSNNQTGLYSIGYLSYKALLQADSTAHPGNSVLSTALAHLAGGNDANGAKPVAVTTALADMLGMDASPCYNSSGNYVSGCGQIYDGVVTLDTTNDSFFYPDSLPGGNEFDAVAEFEHEIDEVLGGGGDGSVLNAIQQNLGWAGTSTADPLYFGPLDLYRYAAPGTPGFSTTAATAYFSVNGGMTDIVGFNRNSGGDYGDFSPAGLVQSAFASLGVVPGYTAASPEFAMMEAIGYDGALPEPGSMAVLVPALAALLGLRWRQRRWRWPELRHAA